MHLLQSLKDDQYRKALIYHPRISARGVVFNERGEVALTHLLAEDKFGKRDYYELPGGGKRLGETVLESAMREMDEELGVQVKLTEKLGIVHDFYNLISQENYSYYYMFSITKYTTTHMEERESGLIDKIIWVSLSEALELFEKQLSITGVGLLVARRELPILKLAASLFDKKLSTK